MDTFRIPSYWNMARDRDARFVTHPIKPDEKISDSLTVVDPPVQAVLPHKHLGRFVDKLQNPWIKVQLKIWNTIRDEYKLSYKLQTQWCAYDPEFKPNTIDEGFKSWILKGI